MAEVTIYGASDDLIEVDGSIYEEFSALHGRVDDDGTGGLLAFSDGTVLDVVYDHNGVWRINRLAAGTADYSKVEAPPEEEDGNYSDRVTLTGAIHWCVYGSEMAKAKETPAAADPVTDRLAEMLQTAPAPTQATVAATGTGRGGTGRLRNFRSMNDEKLLVTRAAVERENNDPEALAAVRAEAEGRGLR